MGKRIDQLPAVAGTVDGGFEFPAMLAGISKKLRLNQLPAVLKVLGMTDAAKLAALPDDELILNNAATPTKKARFSLASITAGVTRVFTLPDANARLLSDAELMVTAADYSSMATGKVVTADALKLAAAALPSLAISAGAVAWNMSNQENAQLSVTGNFTLSNPTGIIVGKKGRIKFVMAGAGNYTMALGSILKTSNGAGFTLTGAVGSITYGYFDVVSLTEIIISPILDVK